MRRSQSLALAAVLVASAVAILAVAVAPGTEPVRARLGRESSLRPASAPTNGNVHTVPSSIPHRCEANASGLIAQWLGTVPNNATARFWPGACYLLNGQVDVANRTGLVIDGNGSTFKRTVLVPDARIWRFDAGSNLTIESMKIVGTDPNHVYNNVNATEHAIGVYGVQGFVASGITATQVWGDCLIATHADAPQTPPANVTLQNSTCDSGRQGVSVIVGSGIYVRGNTFLGSAFDGVNVEPDSPSQAVSNLVIDGNTFDHPTWQVGAEIAVEGCLVSRVTITDNRQGIVPNASAPVSAHAGRGCIESGLLLRGNRWLLNSNNDFRAPIDMINWVDVLIEDNEFAANTPYGFGHIVRLQNSCHVKYSGNRITGPYGGIWRPITADLLSCDIHVQ